MAKQGGQPRKQSKQPGKATGNDTLKRHAVKDESVLLADEIPQRLSFLRDKFSRKILADGASITPKSLDRYITGEQRPGFEVLVGIVNLTGCDPGWLLTGRGEPFPAADPATAARIAEFQAAFNLAAAATIKSAEAAIEHVAALKAFAPFVDPTTAPIDALESAADQFHKAGNRLTTLWSAHRKRTADPPQSKNPRE